MLGFKTLALPKNKNWGFSFNIARFRHDVAHSTSPLQRSYLYVPTSSDRMLEKSLTSSSDVIIYDLEDSVPPSPAAKADARQRLATFMKTRASELPDPSRIAVRLNSVHTGFFQEDVKLTASIPHISTFVLPKVHSTKDLDTVSNELSQSTRPVNFVASIESALSYYNLPSIASWKSNSGANGGLLSALLFAAEDFCADTSIIRTPSRRELLHVRSEIVLMAKAFRLQAIDMVCVNYKDLDYLKQECQDGRELGFTGKQAIHPNQVDIIQSTFVPTPKEILRAARIVHSMKKAHASNRGAIGLQTGGIDEMIDEPMIKQAQNTIRMAERAGLEIPEITD
ncbi:Pyruvate kinase-like domain superfamily protein [Abortiporus biennis]